MFLGKKHTCISCNKAYTTLGALKTHELLDCGKLPSYTCEKCPYSTKRKYNLYMHQRKKHFITMKDIDTEYFEM